MPRAHLWHVLARQLQSFNLTLLMAAQLTLKEIAKVTQLATLLR